MRMEGRIEKRVGMEIPVCLLASDRTGVIEKAITVNVSPHGARVGQGTMLLPSRSLSSPRCGDQVGVGDREFAAFR